MELLCHQARRTTSVAWPADVDQRLNLLVRAAAAAGEQTSRAQLLAALVTAVRVDPDHLAELLHRYRRLPADALADHSSHDFPSVRAPGPRRTR
ncbi:hypothetical protein AB0D12_39815 [Streptomyces sp. NPDC048479]|uniref:hypothetical protein n=1 Tax=Streptomyces sp. NPDC048479 TaxID=3154725 RepID=UPI003439BD3B